MRLQLRATLTKLPTSSSSTAGGRGGDERKGKAHKTFFLFFFFSFKVTAILGVGAEIKPSGHLDSFWGG